MELYSLVLYLSPFKSTSGTLLVDRLRYWQSLPASWHNVYIFSNRNSREAYRDDLPSPSGDIKHIGSAIKSLIQSDDDTRVTHLTGLCATKYIPAFLSRANISYTFPVFPSLSALISTPHSMNSPLGNTIPPGNLYATSFRISPRCPSLRCTTDFSHSSGYSRST